MLRKFLFKKSNMINTQITQRLDGQHCHITRRRSWVWFQGGEFWALSVCNFLTVVLMVTEMVAFLTVQKHTTFSRYPLSKVAYNFNGAPFWAIKGLRVNCGNLNFFFISAVCPDWEWNCIKCHAIKLNYAMMHKQIYIRNAVLRMAY